MVRTKDAKIASKVCPDSRLGHYRKPDTR